MKGYIRMNMIRMICAILGITAVMILMSSCNNNNKQANTETQTPSAPTAEVPQNQKPKIPDHFLYTYVAKCQMRCAKTGPKVIREAIAKGKIKTKKHWLQKKPCPFYAAVYKNPTTGADLVVIFAVCSDHQGGKPATKIVRVYDKNMKECDCANKKVIPSAQSKK